MKRLAFLGQGNLLLHDDPNPKELTNLIKRTAEAGCYCKASESAHRIVSLFDTSVILFYAVVQVDIRPMRDLMAQSLAYCTWIRTMPFGCDRLWGMTNHSRSLREELLCGVHIPLFTQPRINKVPIVINGSVEVAPFSPHLAGGFINIPGFSCLTMSFCTQLICDQGSKTLFPVPNCLLRKHKAPF
jgi:hypothetical protein